MGTILPIRHDDRIENLTTNDASIAVKTDPACIIVHILEYFGNHISTTSWAIHHRLLLLIVNDQQEMQYECQFI